MTSKDIATTLSTLEIVQNCWADQCPHDDNGIADYNAIKQAMECVLEYAKVNKIEAERVALGNWEVTPIE